MNYQSTLVPNTVLYLVEPTRGHVNGKIGMLKISKYILNIFWGWTKMEKSIKQIRKVGIIN